MAVCLGVVWDGHDSRWSAYDASISLSVSLRPSITITTHNTNTPHQQLAAVKAKVAAPHILSFHPRDDPSIPLYAAVYKPDAAVHGPGA